MDKPPEPALSPTGWEPSGILDAPSPLWATQPGGSLVVACILPASSDIKLCSQVGRGRTASLLSPILGWPGSCMQEPARGILSSRPVHQWPPPLQQAIWTVAPPTAPLAMQQDTLPCTCVQPSPNSSFLLGGAGPIRQEPPLLQQAGQRAALLVAAPAV